MLKGLSRLLVVLVLLAPTVVMASPPDWCVRIFVNEEGDYVPESMGSGSLIASDLVVTNHHVVRDRKDDSSIQVMFPDWKIAADARVIAESKKWDLAIIQIRKTIKTPIPLGRDPQYLDKASMHGYGYGIYATGPGTIDSYVEIEGVGSTEGDEKDDLMVLDGVGARQGDSGGAVTHEGKLMGVISMSDGKSTIFIVQSQVRKLLKTINR